MGIAQRLRQVKKFMDGVLGADKYDRYLAHHRANHPGTAPMNEREFWKDYSAWQESNPQGRCC
ncbi:YbdD/YjiX family protein [Glutamicibacter sp. MNS18]|uniref:YbdD/YjiX family protein n=1 Tax=Glutamicibacter sp. MNS18 TaxID=2989817 RepID=UPI0022363A95|nr:YbdD/YjiX family protein [Glutamicibacter sp. MNS18]MCW4466856.1 YbdD/YjiX family protein [Glutamicibacter sp. MNS18]